MRNLLVFGFWFAIVSSSVFASTESTLTIDQPTMLGKVLRGKGIVFCDNPMNGSKRCDLKIMMIPSGKFVSVENPEDLLERHRESNRDFIVELDGAYVRQTLLGDSIEVSSFSFLESLSIGYVQTLLSSRSPEAGGDSWSRAHDGFQ